MVLISPFATELKAGLRGIGKEAEGVIRLREAGLRTPMAWIIPFDQLESISDGPGWMQAYVRTMSQLPQDARYCIRPSLSVEDSFSHPLSRHILTMRNVARDELADAMNHIAGSVVGEGTRDCLRRYGIDPFHVETAIMVQSEVPRVVTGATFSCDPMTGSEGIVSEMVAGSNEGGRWAAPSRCIARRSGRMGNSLLPYPIQVELEGAVRMASEKLHFPIWVEFCFDGERIWYLRSQEIGSLRSLRVFSSTLSGRYLPGMVKPMVWSVIVSLENVAWATLSGISAGQEAARGSCRLVAGRAYCDIGFLAWNGGKNPDPHQEAKRAHQIRETLSGLQGLQALGFEEMDDDALAEARQTLLALVSEAIRYDTSHAISTRPEMTTALIEEAVGYDFSRSADKGRGESSSDQGKQTSAERDNARILRTLSRELLRSYYLEIGRRMVAKQVLLSADDVFYLQADEVAQILAGGCEGNQCNNYRLRAFMRRKELEQQATLILPDAIYGETDPPGRKAADLPHSGIAVASGYFQGRARRLADEGDKVSSGEVMIVPDAGPRWTNAAQSAGSIISGSGGLLSPLSIAAREFGIPAVMSLDGVAGIKEGALLTIDGFTGTVYAEPSPQ